MANTVKDFAAPDGPILLLSAKGSTTAGIAEADGVKDFSGNENHGQAYGGVSISNNAEGFYFDGTDDYINIAGSRFSSINGVEGVTLFCRFKCSSSISDGTRNLVTISLNGSSIGLAMRLGISNGVVNLSYGGRSHDTSQSAKMNAPSTTLNKNQWYSCAIVASTSNHICTAYIDGLWFASITTWHTESFVTPNSVKIGSQSGSNNFFNGSISDVRIYPRALSADEVKYLHGGFQPNLIMGQTIPSGAILDLSARGLTTSGIAQANGVVDRSGNGNHGQAYGGVAVVNDDEMGSSYYFQGTSQQQYLNFDRSFDFSQSFTLYFVTKGDYANRPGFFECRSSGNSKNFFVSSHNNTTGNDKPFRFRYKASGNPISKWSNVNLVSGTLYKIAITFDSINEIIKFYVNGALDSEYDVTGIALEESNYFMVGSLNDSNASRNLNGFLTEFKLYPRVLSLSEIQQLTDASLKKVIDTKLGSSDIKHIYYGSNLVYAKTDTYIDRYPSGTLIQIAPAGTATYYATPHAVVLIPEYGSIKKLIIFDNVNLAFQIYETDGTRRSDTIYTDFNASSRFGDGSLSIAEDPDGYIYAVGIGTGWVVKYRLKSTTQNGQTTYSMEQVAEVKPGGLVAAGQISYCAARDSMIVIGWKSGGGTSIACQLSRDLSTATVVGQWSSPSIGGCFDQAGTRLYFGTYSSNKFAYMTYSSASDTALKTSYTSTTVPPDYASEALSSNDNRYVIAATDGYMYMQMVNGSIFKYSAATESWVGKVGSIGSGASTTRCDYMGTYEYKKHSILYSKYDGSIYRLYL